jgi:hypothetical protein
LNSDQVSVLADYISRAELAKMLRRTDRQLNRWEKEKYGPPVVRIGNKSPYYRRDAVLQWLKSLEQPAPKPERRYQGQRGRGRLHLAEL